VFAHSWTQIHQGPERNAFVHRHAKQNQHRLVKIVLQLLKVYTEVVVCFMGGVGSKSRKVKTVPVTEETSVFTFDNEFYEGE
jgi:hypothetical protein